MRLLPRHRECSADLLGRCGQHDRLGRYVERTQLLAGLIDAQLAVLPSRERFSESDWLSLLRICGAAGAYGRLFSLRFLPSVVVNFLVTDQHLSRSIRFGLETITEALLVISRGRPLAVEAGRRVGRAGARIDYDWPNLPRITHRASQWWTYHAR